MPWPGALSICRDSFRARRNVLTIRTGSGSDRPNTLHAFCKLFVFKLNLWPVATASGSDATTPSPRGGMPWPYP